jgi:hypothetical protein
MRTGSPSLSIRDGRRSVLVKCHAGCPAETVIAALRRDGLWFDTSGREPEGAKAKHHSLEYRRRHLLSIWRQCRPIAGTPAERYLRNRGIQDELPPSLRYHVLKHSPTGLLLPCMIAAVQALDRSIIGLHRTYLRADGADKAPVSRLREVWRPRVRRELSPADARQIVQNVTSFFAILTEWSRAAMPVRANDTTKPPTSDAGEVPDGR